MITFQPKKYEKSWVLCSLIAFQSDRSCMKTQIFNLHRFRWKLVCTRFLGRWSRFWSQNSKRFCHSSFFLTKFWKILKYRILSKFCRKHYRMTFFLKIWPQIRNQHPKKEVQTNFQRNRCKLNFWVFIQDLSLWKAMREQRTQLFSYFFGWNVIIWMPCGSYGYVHHDSRISIHPSTHPILNMYK